MIIDYNIEDLVRKYVNFRHGVASQGWNMVFCESCGDGSRTKGPRGGWLFSDGGETCFYHCFNCGCNENFSINREQMFSKGMRKIFDSFGIPAIEYNALVFKRTKSPTGVQPVKYAHHTILDVPDHFKLLNEVPAADAKPFKVFIRDHYGLSSKDYSFYCATGITASSNIKTINEAKSLKGRLIIPCFKNSKLIYYQARDITNTSKLKYMSPDLPKTNILFNMDQLYRITDTPLYVVEGAMDAIHLSGVATLGNELTTSQADMLEQSKRRKVLVPDFNGDSNRLMERFIERGWDVSFPDYRKKYKDVSEAVINYGKLYTAYDIVTHIKSAKESKMLLSLMKK